MISTFIAYGYQLGGPGDWRLKGLTARQPLRTPWYDETDPTHDFPTRALNEINHAMPGARTNRRLRHRLEASMPYCIDTAIELSPPGWTREASAPPSPVGALPACTPVFALDTPAPTSFVLVVLDSIDDIERREDQHFGPDAEDDEEPNPPAWPVDWATFLDAALMEIGLHAADAPDWFWYRAGTPD